MGFGPVNFQNTLHEEMTHFAIGILAIHFMEWEETRSRQTIDIIWAKRKN